MQGQNIVQVSIVYTLKRNFYLYCDISDQNARTEEIKWELGQQTHSWLKPSQLPKLTEDAVSRNWLQEKGYKLKYVLVTVKFLNSRNHIVACIVK